MKKEQKTLNELPYKNIIFYFNSPLKIDIEYKDGYWTCENKDMGLFSYDISKDKLLYALGSDFFNIWREIALENDMNLDAKAIELKNKLLNIVKDIKTYNN